MVKISSTIQYRLDTLNNERPQAYTFDIYDNDSSSSVRMSYSIDPRFFCVTREEYTRHFRDDLIIKVLEDVNEKFGVPVAMISGSFALLNFMKNKKWEKLTEPMKDEKKTIGRENENTLTPGFHPITTYSLTTNGFYHAFPNTGFYHAICEERFSKVGDIDIFILGKKKREVFTEIIRLLKERLKSPESFRVIEREKGLYNLSLNQKARNEDIPKMLQDYAVSGSLIYQFIMKKVNITPDDVFAFFDLDCCKIGIIPKRKKIRIVTCPSFIQSISYRCNFLDPHLRSGINHFIRTKKYYDEGRNTATAYVRFSEPLYTRSKKYYERTNIATVRVPEPLFARFHTSFKKSRIRQELPIVEWSEWSEWMDEEDEHFGTNYITFNNSNYYNHYSNVKGFPVFFEMKEFHSFLVGKKRKISVDDESYVITIAGIKKDEKTGKYMYKPRDFTHHLED